MNACPQRIHRQRGFTRLDVAAITVVLSLLVLVAIPALATTRTTSTGITCTGNLGKLTLAWQLYASENNGKLVNNFGIADTMGTVSAQTYLNWTHNIMDWTTNPSNTNRTLMATSKLYPYLQNPVNPMKCPADGFRSAAQTQAGWSVGTTGRLRSYAMNGFMGAFAISTNDPSYRGLNILSPNYRQFMQTSSISQPASTMVFIDEHPDSINDGLFINDPNDRSRWFDLPAAYHNSAAGVSFADGHVEIHAWVDSRTRVPVRYTFPNPTAGVNNPDIAWVHSRMSVTHATLAVTRSQTGSKIVWSPTTSNFGLQSTPSLDAPNWTGVSETLTKDYGQVTVNTTTQNGERYFRLIRP